jgi:hypothetical protein
MNHFQESLFAWSITTAIVFGVVSTPASARVGNVSNADKVALKRAVVACEAQEDQVALAPEIRERLRHGSYEGPSQDGHYDLAQKPSELDGSSGRALAWLLDG